MGTFVGASANGGNVTALTTGNSFPVTWPAGIQAGDLAILAWSFGDSTVTVTSDPTGFTLVSQVNDGNLQSRILKRVCAGTESGALSGWLLSLANRQSAVLYVVRGFSDIGGLTSRQETVTGTSHDCPAITTASGAATGDSLIVIGADRAGSTAASPPAGFAERTGTEAVAAGTGGTVTTIADDGLSTGATLPVDPAAFTGYASSGTAVTWTIALRPAATSLALTAAGTATSSGSAALTESLALAASGTASSSGSAALDLVTGPVTHPLAAAGAAASAGTAALSLKLPLAAPGAAASSGSAAVSLKLPLAAAGASNSSGTADVVERLAVTGAGTATSSGSAALTLIPGATAYPLSASGTAASSGSVVLAATHSLSGAGAATSSGDAALTADLPLAAAGQASTAGAVDLRLFSPTTPRPSTGTTPRPATVLTPRPNAGITPRP
jgi:hypothetical protein